MDTIKSALDAARAAGRAAVLCTVVERRGSAPRGPGAMMVWTGGGFAGTIGGGLVEYEAQQEARRVLETKTFTQQTYRLTNEGAADLGMVCGGQVTVWFTYLPPAEIPDLAAGRFLTLTEGGGAAVSDHSEPGVHGGRFSVALQRPGMVYLFGGGHVSQALAPVLDRIDFAVTVVEERPEFLSPDLFPTARALVRADFFRLSDALTLTADDYAIVMTRATRPIWRFCCKFSAVRPGMSAASAAGKRSPIPRPSSGRPESTRPGFRASIRPSVWPSAPRRRRKSPSPSPPS